jgi:acyl carrier protein
MNDFILKLEELFDRSSSIELSDNFKEYDEWDSLALLSLMALLEDEYNMTIPRNDFEKILTIEDLCVYIKSNQNG